MPERIQRRKKLPDEHPNLEAAIYNLIHALEPVDD